MNTAPVSRLDTEIRAVAAVWRRECVLFLRERTRLLPGPLPTLLILVLLGTGLGAAPPPGDPHAGHAAFLLPGVLVMVTQPPALAAGARFLRERQSAHLDQMLVAPVRRESLLLGKVLAGTTVATCHGAVLTVLVTAVGPPRDHESLAGLMTVLVLASFATTCLAVLLALCLGHPRAFRTTVGLLLGPLALFSGAFFPLGLLAPWVVTLCAFNPLTHAVEAARRALAAPDGSSPHPWSGVPAPTPQEEWAVLACCGLLCLLLAARRLSRPDHARPQSPPPR